MTNRENRYEYARYLEEAGNLAQANEIRAELEAPLEIQGARRVLQKRCWGVTDENIQMILTNPAFRSDLKRETNYMARWYAKEVKPQDVARPLGNVNRKTRPLGYVYKTDGSGMGNFSSCRMARA